MAWKINKPKEETETEEIKEEKKPVLPTFRKSEVKDRTVVVKELPLRPIREYKEDDGTTVHLVTIEEALTMLMND